MTELPMPDSSYMGICSSTDASAPESPAGYAWVRFAGKDADSSYIHVRYRGEEGGMTEIPEESSRYLGICVSRESTAPEDVSAYQWCLISYGNEVEELRQALEGMREEMEAVKSELKELKSS